MSNTSRDKTTKAGGIKNNLMKSIRDEGFKMGITNIDQPEDKAKVLNDDNKKDADPVK